MSEYSTLKKELSTIFHMEFSINGKCIVFLTDKDDDTVKCAAARENFIQDEVKY